MNKKIVVNEKKCTGCRICEMICSFTSSPEKIYNPAQSRIKIIKQEEDGIDLPVLCFHCEAPLCMDSCPAEAIQIRPDGVVQIDESLCSGCQACMAQCPYGAIRELHGQIIKCDLCGGKPSCVQWCPTQALQYVEMDPAESGENRRRMRAMIAHLGKK